MDAEGTDLARRLAEAEKSVERLQAVVEASLQINSSLELEDLLQNLLAVALRTVRSERGTIYLVDEERREIWSRLATGLGTREIRVPIGRGIAGEVAASGTPLIISDPYADPRFDSSFDRVSGFRTRSILCVPILNRQRRVVGVFQLLNRDGEFADLDIDFLEALSSHAALAIENARMQITRVEQERMAQQLAVAKDVQAQLLPGIPPRVPGLEIEATSVSCFEIGGDYYDFIPLQFGRICIAIGDVSGKGVGAALIMSNLQAALRVVAPEGEPLEVMAKRLNTLLHQTTRSRQFVTLFLAIYDSATRRLSYVNAGHTPGLLLRGGSVRQLEATGIPLGAFAVAEFAAEQAELAAGDRLLLYTDGLSEAQSPDDREYGIESISSWLLSNGERRSGKILGGLMDEVREFEGNAPPGDDKTAILLSAT